MGLTCQRGERFFREIRKPFPRTVRNKEELSLRATMDLVGPSRQALHVESSSDHSRLLTTLHRTQRGDGRQRGLGRERLRDGKMRQWSRRLRGGEGL